MLQGVLSLVASRIWLTVLYHTADSQLSWRYFSEITAMHLTYPETAVTTLYAASTIFDRNAHLVPGIVRVTDVLWCAAGLSGQYRSSAISPPSSVYSIPFETQGRRRLERDLSLSLSLSIYIYEVLLCVEPSLDGQDNNQPRKPD